MKFILLIAATAAMRISGDNTTNTTKTKYVPNPTMAIVNGTIVNGMAGDEDLGESVRIKGVTLHYAQEKKN